MNRRIKFEHVKMLAEATSDVPWHVKQAFVFPGLAECADEAIIHKMESAKLDVPPPIPHESSRMRAKLGMSQKNLGRELDIDVDKEEFIVGGYLTCQRRDGDIDRPSVNTEWSMGGKEILENTILPSYEEDRDRLYREKEKLAKDLDWVHRQIRRCRERINMTGEGED